MDERLGGRAVLNDIRTQWPELKETLRELPTLVRRVGEQAASGELRFSVDTRELREMNERLRRSDRRRYRVTLGLGAIAFGAAMAVITTPRWWHWATIAVGGVAGLSGRPD